ncbi:hypothetical protein K438DRAFT_1967150 [Mycena galopus ATCC 62051]|nr:hypothetical protein K438DRAFT_1967150 [Mycena galopus ATCC 62051]
MSQLESLPSFNSYHKYELPAKHLLPPATRNALEHLLQIEQQLFALCYSVEDFINLPLDEQIPGLSPTVWKFLHQVIDLLPRELNPRAIDDSLVLMYETLARTQTNTRFTIEEFINPGADAPTPLVVFGDDGEPWKTITIDTVINGNPYCASKDFEITLNALSTTDFVDYIVDFIPDEMPQPDEVPQPDNAPGGNDVSLEVFVPPKAARKAKAAAQNDNAPGENDVSLELFVPPKAKARAAAQNDNTPGANDVSLEMFVPPPKAKAKSAAAAENRVTPPTENDISLEVFVPPKAARKVRFAVKDSKGKGKAKAADEEEEEQAMEQPTKGKGKAKAVEDDETEQAVKPATKGKRKATAVEDEATGQRKPATRARKAAAAPSKTRAPAPAPTRPRSARIAAKTGSSIQPVAPPLVSSSPAAAPPPASPPPPSPPAASPPVTPPTAGPSRLPLDWPGDRTPILDHATGTFTGKYNERTPEEPYGQKRGRPEGFDELPVPKKPRGTMPPVKKAIDLGPNPPRGTIGHRVTVGGVVYILR